MIMNTTVRRIGNSLGVILPKELLDRYGIKEGDALDVNPGHDSIELSLRNADLAEQLKAARIGMEKYRVALRELAK
jgi:putative addiction module antidote